MEKSLPTFQMLTTQFQCHSRLLKSKNNFNIYFTNNSILTGSLLYEGVRIFNALLDETKKSTTVVFLISISELILYLIVICYIKTNHSFIKYDKTYNFKHL